MKPLRQSLVMVVVVMIIVCAGEMAFSAGGHSGGGHYRGGHYGGYYRGPDFGVVIGGPYWGASWNYPYYYPYYNPYYYPYAPEVTVPSRPQEYIEQSQRKSSPRSSGVWYFCPESKSYYPYVRECPGGWQKVPAQPPPESGR
jgi:hypothetical protein